MPASCPSCKKEFVDYVETKRAVVLPCSHHICESCTAQQFQHYGYTICNICKRKYKHKPEKFSFANISSVIKTDLKRGKHVEDNGGENYQRCDLQDCLETATNNCLHCSKNFCSIHFLDEIQFVRQTCEIDVMKARFKLNDMQNIYNSVVKEGTDSIDNLSKAIVALEDLQQKLVEEIQQLKHQKKTDQKNLDAKQLEWRAEQSKLETIVAELESILRQPKYPLSRLWSQKIDLDEWLEYLSINAPSIGISSLSVDFRHLQNEFNEQLDHIKFDLKRIQYGTASHKLVSNTRSLISSSTVTSIPSSNGQPCDVTLCDNTKGFCIHHDLIVKRTKRLENTTDLPNQILLVNLSGEHDWLTVLDENCMLIGYCQFDLQVTNQCIENIAAWPGEPKLFISDSTNSLIHLCHINGDYISCSKSKDLVSPRGLTIMNHVNRDKSILTLLVCDWGDSSVKKFSLPKLKLLQIIQVDSFQYPYGISVGLESEIWVCNCTENGSVSVLDCAGNELKVIPDFHGPFSIVHNVQGNVFVSDIDRVIELDSYGNMLSVCGLPQICGPGKDEFCYPQGLALVSIQPHTLRLVICDNGNFRFKMFDAIIS